ncbi:MAG TPA: NAD(P)-dependent oxidoreductase, partial [Symbiobacteriaceae bacterium]|nr:NAD(P)-dependent oxidoreductase [Symbiobacteriaceae bacterium]
MAALGIYAVGLELEGADCLVVGGGEVAARKVAGLREAGARVTVIAPELAPGLKAMAGAG